MLDVADFGASPAAPELGGLGVCHVRYGKAMRGSPPRRRAVATVCRGRLRRSGSTCPTCGRTTGATARRCG